MIMMESIPGKELTFEAINYGRIRSSSNKIIKPYSTKINSY